MMEDIFPRGTEVWYLDTDELEVKHGTIEREPYHDFELDMNMCGIRPDAPDSFDFAEVSDVFKSEEEAHRAFNLYLMSELEETYNRRLRIRDALDKESAWESQRYPNKIENNDNNHSSTPTP